MKRISLTLFLAVLVGVFSAVHAQNVSDLIISEVMAVPDSSGIVDDYGRKSAWIEIFNTSQGTVKFGGCFLSDDRNNLKKSFIPKSDSRTSIGPRQSVLFYASGNSGDGTFYLNFLPKKGSTIYLVSNDGRTIVDSICIPAAIPDGKSVIKRAHDLRQMKFETEAEPAEPSPAMINSTDETETGAQKMAREDKHGFILSLVSVSVVFSALLILWWLFSLLGKVSGKPAGRSGSRKEQKANAGAAGEPTPEVTAAIALALDQELNGEVYAAIAEALHIYMEESVHDKESFVITIRHRESGWNTKEQGFRQLPR